MTALAWVRLVMSAILIAAVQALLLDQSSLTVLRHLDLPLAVVIALVLTRPADAAVIGFLFGLAVDCFQHRLFGLHVLAYCTLGPLVVHLPVNVLRHRSEVLAALVTAQAVFATGVVVTGAWLLDGRLVSELLARFVQVTLWSVVIAVPLSAVLGSRVGLTAPGRVERQPIPMSTDWL